MGPSCSIHPAKSYFSDGLLGRIDNITINGAQGTARGTSVILGHADRPLKNLTIEGLRVKMLPENRPDKRATHAMVMEHVEGLTLRNIDVRWDDQSPEPAWGSALVLRGIDQLRMDGFHGSPGSRAAGVQVIQRERVRDDLR
jgi:hypothetical protein